MTLSPIEKTPKESLVIESFNKMKEAHGKADFSSYKNRLDRIERLLKATLANRYALHKAMMADFKKPIAEVDITEILPVTTEARHIKSKLKRWMRDEQVESPITMIGAPSYIRYEPKGVVLVIAPWNFPFLLCVGPLMSALAAGNSVIIKPSEMTPNTSALLAKMIQDTFSPEEVCLYEGGVQTAEILLKQPFNHIFFTGSPRVGKIIMKAAAENLASVTLELGGKSPVIVDETANIKKAAERIMWSKCLNGGQICITPDYAYVHEKVKDKFIEALQTAAEKYFEGAPLTSPHFARIIDDRNFKRVSSYIDDALEKGARLEMGGQTSAKERFISPTVMTNVSLESDLMKEEIFGPVLPIQTFTDLADPIRFIQKGEKPLSMYIFSENRKNIRRLINETRVGGTTINMCLVHFFNHNLPFGGSNNSGIGKAHGVWGFKAFSNARGVVDQKLPSISDLLRMPYTKAKRKMVNFAIKWL